MDWGVVSSSKSVRVVFLLVIGAGASAPFSKFRAGELYFFGWLWIAIVSFVFSVGLGLYWGGEEAESKY